MIHFNSAPATRHLLALLLVTILATPSIAHGQFDSSKEKSQVWTSIDGAFSVKATLVGFDAKTAHLKRDDTGLVVKVPLTRLSKNNQAYVEIRQLMADRGKRPAGPPAKKIEVENVGKGRIGLVPFGTIISPSNTMAWKVASTTPPVFAGVDQGQGEALVVTVVPPNSEQEQRVAFMKGQYNALVEQLKTVDPAVRGTKLNLTDLKAIEEFYLTAGEVHAAVVVQFNAEQTLVFQASGRNQQRALQIAATHKTLEPLALAPSQIPQATTQAVDAHVKALLAAIDGGDPEAVFKLVMSPEKLKSMKAMPLEWHTIVTDFKSKKAAPLRDILSKLDWMTAKYDAQSERVTFPGGMVFAKVNGAWQLQN